MESYLQFGVISGMVIAIASIVTYSILGINPIDVILPEYHYKGELVAGKPHYEYTGIKAFDGTWIVTCIVGEWVDNGITYTCDSNRMLTTSD